MLDHSRRLKISKEKLEQLLDVEIPRMYVVGLAIFAVGNLVLAIVTGVVPPKGVPWVDKRWPKVASSTSSRVSDGGRGLNFSTSLLALILMEATAVICDLFAIWSLLRGKDWIRKAIVETRLVRNGTPA